MAAGTESLDAEVLKDLRGLGEAPSIDGNDAEHQDLRFSFRIHMSLVSSRFSRADGQMRHRAKSDLPGSRESAG